MAKTWGTPTWYFFHSLAENVDKDFYKNNSETIKKYIINICSNLPCHECTKHAKSYLNKHLKNRRITNKEELKKFLFEFFYLFLKVLLLFLFRFLKLRVLHVLLKYYRYQKLY